MSEETLQKFGFARLTHGMIEKLSSLVSGKTVYDLGCGDKTLSQLCRKSGARRVISIDKDHDDCHLFRNILPTLKPKLSHVSILSWPSNYLHCQDETALINFLGETGTVIVVACMTGGTICGTPNLWGHLRNRDIIWSERNRVNSFIVYGGGLRHNQHIQEEDPESFVKIIGFKS